MERFPLSIVALLITAGGLLTGCNSQQTTAEREALWTENQTLRGEKSRLESALDAAEAERARLEAENQQLAGELGSLRAAPRQTPVLAKANDGFGGIAGVETERRADGGIAVRVPGDVLFAPGKIELKSTAKRTLDQIAQAIRGNHAGKSVRVEGYTDTDPIKRSGWKDNLELSLQRAAAVQRFLQSQGVANEMYSAGFGEQRARDSKANSRRVEIVVVMQE
jgi:chemotaxis protein MotB